MATSIFVRSPYIVSKTSSVGNVVKAELYIYNNPSSVPSSPTYTLSKVIPSSVATTAHFDISPYCREYISFQKFTSASVETAAGNDEYCNIQVKVYVNEVLDSTTDYVAFDGFGYYEQGYNPSLGDTSGITDSAVFLDEGTYYVKETGNGGGIYFHNVSGSLTNAVYNSTDSISLNNGVKFVPYVHPSHVGVTNVVEIYEGGFPVRTYTFEPICEPKYTPLVCDFINQYGVWQQIIFFKASERNFVATGTEYNLMPSSINYDIYENRRQVFNRNAKKSITANTGFVPESYSNVMKAMLLSEKIMLDNEPVKLRTQNVKLQEHINDKLINYRVEFEYSHNQLNYVI